MTKTKFIIFVSMIAFLLSTVQQVSAQENSVPDWVRDVAGWWNDGSISTDEYTSSIKWLIEHGIISLSGIAIAQTDPEKPVLELQVASDSQVPALIVKNENNDSLFTVHPDGSIQIGSNSVVIHPDASIGTGGDPLIVRASISGQAYHLQEWQHSSGTVLASISDNGTLTLTNLECNGCIDATDIDSTQVQKRVIGNCSVGSSIRAINSDGSVVCELDNDTLTDASQFQRTVTGNCSVGSSIRAINSDGSVICDGYQPPNLYIKTDTFSVPPGERVPKELRCDSSDTLVSGGFEQSGYMTEITVHGNSPLGSESLVFHGWRIQIGNEDTNFETSITIKVVCADTSQ